MARADAGLTISQLAEKAGVSRDTISKAEKGQHNLQAGTLSKVARALGTTASELLAEEERHLPKALARPEELTDEERGEELFEPLSKSEADRASEALSMSADEFKAYIDSLSTGELRDLRKALGEHAARDKTEADRLGERSVTILLTMVVREGSEPEREAAKKYLAHA